MAYTRIIFSHRGRVSKDSLDDKAFIAFNISMTTRLCSLLGVVYVKTDILLTLTMKP